MKKVCSILFLCLICLSGYTVNQFLEFDGTDDFISFTTYPAYTTTFTIEAWIKTTSSADARNIVCWGNSNSSINDNVQFRTSLGKLSFGTHPQGGDWISCQSSVNVNTGEWTHVAVVKNGGAVQLYVNGVADGSGTNNNSMNVNYMVIGKYVNSQDYFSGSMDEIRIWSDVRDVNEIRQNMYRELPDPSSEEHLVAYYKFNETSGTTLTDSKGSNDGTLTNYGSQTGYWQTSPAMFGTKNQLDFDGTDDYIGFDNSPPYSETISIEAWIKTTSVEDARNIVCWGNSNSSINDNVQFRTSLGKLSFGTHPQDGGWISCQSSVDVNTGEWTHVAVVKNGVSVQLYVNGIADGSGTNNNSMNVDYMVIGKYVNSQDYFSGSMDEIRIWNTARTASEIRESMCKTLTGNESGLIAYYNFDNMASPTLQDFSGHTYDGTLTNMDPATDWVASSAFNTWLNTSSSDWSTASNWSNGVPSSTGNVGIYNLDAEPDLSGSLTFNNLYLGTGISTTLLSGMTVNSSLILDTDLDLNGKTVTLGSTGTLIENSGRLYGSTGTITTTRTLGAVTNENVAGLGAEITTAASLGSTTITRSHAVQSGAGNMGIQRCYDIVPETASGLDATLVFHYDDAELYGKTESDLMLFRSADNGATWASQGGTVDTEANTITLSGIDAFSRWTASDSEHPLPVTLSEFSALFIQQPTLFWTTQSENGNAGWHVWRSGESDYGTAQQISVDLIAGAGSCTVPTEYQFTDQAVYQAGCQYYYWLESISIAGESELHGPITLTIPQGSQQSPPTSQVYGLMQNHPNPFNPCTEISFVLPQSAHCTIDVYDIAGRKVNTLIDEVVAAKELKSVLWQGDDAQGNPVASGIYFYKMRAGKYTATKKMILMK